MIRSIELWFREIRDQATGRWRQTRYTMTDDDARTRFGGEAKKVVSFAQGQDRAPQRRPYQRLLGQITTVQRGASCCQQDEIPLSLTGDAVRYDLESFWRGRESESA